MFTYNLSMIDSKYLTFIEVCNTENFTSAAFNLGLTQPAVSQHIKQLEAEFVSKLFVREGKKIALTEPGQILLKYARRMQNLENDLARKIADSKKGATSLIIGVTPTSESTETPEILASYSSQKSGTYIKIITDSIRNLYDKLSAFQIDMAIVEGKVQSSKYSSVLLDTDSLQAIVSKNNPLSKNKMVSMSELMKEHLILRNIDSGTTTMFVSALSKIDMGLENLDVFLELDNVASIKDLVKKNMGVSVLPRSACIDEIKKGSLVALPIENMNMVREISLVYLKDNVEPEILSDIVGLYRNKARE